MSAQFLHALASVVPEGRVFGLDLQTLLQIIAHIVNVSLLALVLAYLLYKPVRNFLRNRAERIQGQLQQAEVALAQANDLKLEYERKIKAVEQEKNEILDAAHKMASESSRQLIAAAKKEADAIMTRASASIELERERVQAEMRHAIIDTSTAMTAKFMSVNMSREAQDEMFSQIMAELEETTWQS